MAGKEICFVTSNKNKLREAEGILGTGLEQLPLDLEEIQALDNRKVCESKARQAYSIAGKPIIVEDTALFIEEWKGFPGALIAWVIKTIGVGKLCKLLGKERKAKARACVSYCDGKTLRTFCGEIEGKISGEPRGRKRFDWDRIFIPAGETRTFAEMSPEEKNGISHRKKAFEKLKRFLERY